MHEDRLVELAIFGGTENEVPDYAQVIPALATKRGR
jgi:hypothetical protein